MDKFVFLICIDPDVYEKIYNSGTVHHMEYGITEPVADKGLSYGVINITRMLTTLRSYCESELMKQYTKAVNFIGAMNIYSTFLWNYFYPYEHIWTNFNNGKQFVFFITLTEEEHHKSKIWNHLPVLMEEHNYINCSDGRMMTICVTDNPDTKGYDKVVCSDCSIGEIYERLSQCVDDFIKEKVQIRFTSSVENSGIQPFTENVYATVKGTCFTKHERESSTAEALS